MESSRSIEVCTKLLKFAYNRRLIVPLAMLLRIKYRVVGKAVGNRQSAATVMATEIFLGVGPELRELLLVTVAATLPVTSDRLFKVRSEDLTWTWSDFLTRVAVPI